MVTLGLSLSCTVGGKCHFRCLQLSVREYRLRCSISLPPKKKVLDSATRIMCSKFLITARFCMCFRILFIVLSLFKLNQHPVSVFVLQLKSIVPKNDKFAFYFGCAQGNYAEEALEMG